MGKIILGDCLEVMRGMADNQFDLVLTDPPYGIGIGGKSGKVGGGSKRGATKEYGHQEWDSQPLDKEYIDEIKRISKNQIIWGGNYYIDYLSSTRCMLVWFKRDGLPIRTFADCEIAWTSYDKNSMVFNLRWDGFITDTRDIKYPHPTQKPLELMKWCLSEFAQEGNTILDPFMGSGTTLRACKDLGFDCTGIEISEAYVKIAQDRLKQEVLL